MPSPSLQKNLDFHLELANKIVYATGLVATVGEREKQRDWLMHAITNSDFDSPKPNMIVINREIELLQSAKQKIIAELSHYNEQHLSLFKNFYYPEDTETLNAYGKNLTNWLKGIRTPYMPLHMAAEKLRRELKPLQDRTRMLSQGLTELENQLKYRGSPKSNLAASLSPLTANKVVEHRTREEVAAIPSQHEEITKAASLISEMHTDLEEFCSARQKYRRETKALRTEIDDLLHLLPSTPVLRLTWIEDSNLSTVVHKIAEEVIHSMGEIMKDDIKIIADSARESVVEHLLRALERPHCLIEQELKKEALEEGEISELEDAFKLVFTV